CGELSWERRKALSTNRLNFQKDTRLRPDRHGHHRMGLWLAGAETESPDQGGKNDARLHHGEIGADTDPRRRAKGQILIFVALGPGIAIEAIGIETVGPLPQQFMAMQRPDRQE